MPLAIDGVQVHGAEAIGQVLALQQAAVHGRPGPVAPAARRGQGRRQGEAQGGDEQGGSHQAFVMAQNDAVRLV